MINIYKSLINVGCQTGVCNKHSSLHSYNNNTIIPSVKIVKIYRRMPAISAVAAACTLHVKRTRTIQSRCIAYARSAGVHTNSIRVCVGEYTFVKSLLYYLSNDVVQNVSEDVCYPFDSVDSYILTYVRYNVQNKKDKVSIWYDPGVHVAYTMFNITVNYVNVMYIQYGRRI